MNGRVGKEYKNSRVISTTTTAKKKNEEDNWPFGGMMTAFLLFDYWNLFDFFFWGGWLEEIQWSVAFFYLSWGDCREMMRPRTRMITRKVLSANWNSKRK